MSLSFINFIENIEIENFNKNNSLYIKETPIFENKLLNSFNLIDNIKKNITNINNQDAYENKFVEDNIILNNNNSFSETEEVKQERLIQILKLDIISLNSTVTTFSFENMLLSNIYIFFDLPKNNNLILTIFNKYSIIIANNIYHWYRALIKKKKFNNLIFYRICISNLKRDLRIHVTDIKGEILFMCSAKSCLDLLYRRVKYIKRKLVLKLIDYFLEQSSNFFSEEEENTFFFNNTIFIPTIPIALHLKNLQSRYTRTITKKFKKKFKIQSIDSYCTNPHNGCRPKKIRRVKQRKKKRN